MGQNGEDNVKNTRQKDMKSTKKHQKSSTVVRCTHQTPKNTKTKVTETMLDVKNTQNWTTKDKMRQK
jgi:hypothetical protein